jgi:hypothetical protein
VAFHRYHLANFALASDCTLTTVRSSAINGGGGGLAVALLIGFLAAASAPIADVAALYIVVGDYGGWNFNVDRWVNGRTFRAGSMYRQFFPLFIASARHDGLCSRAVFTYNLSVHDVVILNVVAYESCVLPSTTGFERFAECLGHSVKRKNTRQALC